MPPKTYRKKKKVIKYRKKRTVQRYTKRSIPLAGTPQTQVVKFRYTERVILNPDATGYVTTLEYRCLGPADPTVAVGGNPVQNWTDYKEHYQHYCVLGSKISVTNLPTTSTSSVPGMWGIALSRASTPFNPALTTSMDILRSSGSGKDGNKVFRTMGGLNPLPMTTLSKGFSTRKFYSIPAKDSVINYPGVKSDTSTTPVENPVWIIWAGNNTAGADPDPQTFYIVIDYVCKVWEPKLELDL